ncbi:MAG: hypothetical protein JW891_04395 [Candidatus Lokiarchaeota archaeon]|nr:hypothetical protein [Candidatus Lokiarchaeota archaeon]
MVKVFSWIGKQMGYIKNSVAEIVKGLVLVIMVSSGLLVSILLRYFNQNGIMISVLGIFVEVIALIIVSYFLQNYLKSEESEKNEKE